MRQALPIPTTRPVLAGLAGVALTGSAAFAVLRRRFGVVAVAGLSMRPTLLPGDACLVHYGARIRPEMVVVARLPDRPLGVKRAALHDDDGWWLSSDDPRNGTDSATFGSVSDEDVLGRVVARYWPRPTWFGVRPPSARSLA